MSRKLRCAIYTRKSTEEGLEQEFNSLDAQRQACEAYIASQRSLGWTTLPSRYDDGGISGGTMERPALQRLLADIEAKRIDLVLVYKIDRLTRSLSDFARIVEIFEAHGVSFVSVTQQFNTTTSMGRLTLNVLLSFAQFEREVTAERIRDKIAASKRKGMWMGGSVPLGYDLKDKKLVINPQEAEIVRSLFRLYLELGTVKSLLAETKRRGLLTKQRQGRDGRQIGGLPFSRGHLYQLLRNPLYVGEVAHKGQRHPGQQQAILDRETFDAAQKRLASNASDRRSPTNLKSPSLLTGLLYDETGERLCPTHATKQGRRYRYYISKRLMHREGSPKDGWRLPARHLEELVIGALKRFLTDGLQVAAALELSRASPQSQSDLIDRAQRAAHELSIDDPAGCRQVLERLVESITLGSGSLCIQIRKVGLGEILSAETEGDRDRSEEHYDLTLPISPRRRGVEARLLIGDGKTSPPPDEALVALVRKGHRRWEKLVNGEVGSVQELAKAEGVHASDIGRSLHIAFLAPDIIKAILAGRQPAELTATQLRRIGNLPIEWAHQKAMLGFAD